MRHPICADQEQIRFMMAIKNGCVWNTARFDKAVAVVKGNRASIGFGHMKLHLPHARNTRAVDHCAHQRIGCAAPLHLSLNKERPKIASVPHLRALIPSQRARTDKGARFENAVGMPVAKPSRRTIQRNRLGLVIGREESARKGLDGLKTQGFPSGCIVGSKQPGLHHVSCCGTDFDGAT